jgi:hypothetical protein
MCGKLGMRNENLGPFLYINIYIYISCVVPLQKAMPFGRIYPNRFPCQ